MQQIPDNLYSKLKYLGIIPSEIRSSNVGESDYSKHTIQPWSIWLDYGLNPWDADLVKRILRTKNETGKKKEDSRIMDYEKIIHICKERLRQLGKEIEDIPVPSTSSSDALLYKLDKVEFNEYMNFAKEHRNKHEDTCEISLIFTTGLDAGIKKSVQCETCKDKKDITNYQNW